MPQNGGTKGAKPVDVDVGARIRMRRNMLGLSQTQMGDHIGVTFQQVQKYERGTNRIGASRLLQICNVLQVTRAWMFEGAPGPKPKPTAAAREMETAFTPFQADDAGPRLVSGWLPLPTRGKRLMGVLMAASAGAD